MKLLVVILFGFCMSLQANVFSQQFKVSLDIKESSLDKVLLELRRQTKCDFFFNYDLIKEKKVKDLKIDNIELEVFLSSLLPNLGLEHSFDDKVVVIKQKIIAPQKTEAIKVTGKVVDEKQIPLIGVTILLKGTLIGTATDTNGVFIMTIPDMEKVVLVFSFIGMETKEIEWDKKTELNIVLVEDKNEMDEVVVTGLFNKPRESYTGAVKTITSQELKKSGNRNLLSTIRNIDPGFNVIENNNFGSDPNVLPDINIRGNASMDISIQDLQNETRNQNNLPLFIMDGFEISLTKMMDLDQNIVETITILKDASATAMYGTRGANGVVVITSRKPEAGKLRLSYNANLNIEAPDLRSYNLMNAREKLEYEKAAGLYENESTYYEQVLLELYYERLAEVTRGVDTYWIKYPVRTGVGNKHSLRIEGGSDEMRYSVNISNDNVQGVMKRSYRNNTNGDIFISYQHKKIIFQNNLIIALNKSRNSPYGTFGEFTKINSYYKPYDDEGNLIMNLENNRTYSSLPLTGYITVSNPLWNAKLPSREESKYTQIKNNFAIEWKPLDELTLRGRFGYTKQTNRSDNYIPSEHTKFATYTGSDYARKGEYTYGTGESSEYEASFLINYSKVFNGIHQLFVGGNYDFSESKNEYYSIKAEGISNPNMDFLGMASMYEKDGRPKGSEGISRRVGGIINLNYTYDRRYFADFSGKLEGSSKFGAKDRTAPFWSAGIGWNIHNEDFLKKQNLISSIRLRYSYGTSGSQNFATYQAITTFKDFGNKNYNGWYGVYLMGMGNEKLGWQITYQQNIGFDIEILKGRIQLNTDIYSKITDDMLADIQLPSAAGFDTYKANIGKVTNKGIEINLNAFPIRNTSNGWIWSIGASLAHNKNRIKKISNSLEFLNQILMNEDNINPSFLYKEGQSMNTIFAVKSLGIDPSNGKEIFVKQDGSLTYEWDAKDKVPCGVEEPKIWGNMNTSVTYKNLTLTAIFSYRHGGQIYNRTLISKVENIYPYDNADKRAYYNRWKTPGENALYKSVRDFSTTKASSRFVMDESTFQCRNISLQYECSSEWLRKNLSITYLSFAGYMEDVFRISTIKQERGIAYPFSRKFSFSLTARF